MPIIQQFHLGAQATVSTARHGLTVGHKIVIVQIGGQNQSPTYDIEEAADAAGADAISAFALLLAAGGTAAQHPVEAAAASSSSLLSVTGKTRSSIQALCDWRSLTVQPGQTGGGNLLGPTAHVGKRLPTCPVVSNGSLIIAHSVSVKQAAALGLYEVSFVDAQSNTVTCNVPEAVVDSALAAASPAPVPIAWTIDLQGSPILHLVKRFPLSSSCPPNEAAGSDLLAVLGGCKQIISHLAKDQTSNNIIISMLNTLVQNAMNGRYTPTALDFSSGTWPSDPAAFGEAIIGAQPSGAVQPPTPRAQVEHPLSDALEKAAGTPAIFAKVCAESIDTFEKRQPKQQRVLANPYYMAGCIERTLSRWGITVAQINVKFHTPVTSPDPIPQG